MIDTEEQQLQAKRHEDRGAIPKALLDFHDLFLYGQTASMLELWGQY